MPAAPVVKKKCRSQNTGRSRAEDISDEGRSEDSSESDSDNHNQSQEGTQEFLLSFIKQAYTSNTLYLDQYLS